MTKQSMWVTSWAKNLIWSLGQCCSVFRKPKCFILIFSYVSLHLISPSRLIFEIPWLYYIVVLHSTFIIDKGLFCFVRTTYFDFWVQFAALGTSKFIPHFTTRKEKRRMALRTKRYYMTSKSEWCVVYDFPNIKLDGCLGHHLKYYFYLILHMHLQE